MLLPETRKRNSAEIGSTIKAKRKELGMTQKEFGDKLGLNYYTMVSQIELGYVTLPPALWVPVADILGLDKVVWVTTCLESIMPEVFSAMFGRTSRSKVINALRSLQE